MVVPTGASATVVQSASIDIPKDGVITNIYGHLFVSVDATPANGDTLDGELSFGSSQSLTVNDSRQSIAQMGLAVVFADAARIVWAGMHFMEMNGINIPVSAGERIFIHLLANQTDITGRMVAYLHVDDGLDTGRSQRRR
jgi:hypothetical protein